MLRRNGINAANPRITNRRLIIWAALLLMLGATVGHVLAKPDGEKATSRQDFLEGIKVLGAVYERVFYNYVDDIDSNELLDAGINGMLDYLDEHSQYLPPTHYENLMMSTEGEFGGLGITINVRDHFPTVVSPIEGTPAFLMGIQGGDKIIEIEGETTLDFTSNDAVKLLRGEPGTAVTITIDREGTDKPFPLTIVRDIIKVESVPYAFMIDDIGYVRIQNFARSTTDEVRESMKALEAKGARGMVLDLRWNPGGLLDAACGVSEMFLESGDLIVYTKGRLRNQNRSYFAEDRGQSGLTELPMVVMINGASASASEIVSAAVQDHDRGLVVGTTSFGKGSVQTVFPLAEDKAIKLTTAKYYTPAGRSIHKDRHTDDSIDLTETASDDVADEVEVPREDREQFETDNGRLVYGGGGITPDIEIKQPFLSDFQVALERDYALFQFATKWSAHHEVTENLVTDDAMIAEFHEFLDTRENLPEYLEHYELTLNAELLAEEDDYVRQGLRREIMRLAFGQEAAYRVGIEDDLQLQETLQLFERASTTEELLSLAAEWEAQRVAEVESDSEAVVH
jgi:carboxyl-terminal processing protease